MGITSDIWLETQACSYMVGHTVNNVFSKNFKSHICLSLFMATSTLETTTSTSFSIFLYFLSFFHKTGSNLQRHGNSLQDACQLKLVRYWKFEFESKNFSTWLAICVKQWFLKKCTHLPNMGKTS